MNIISKAVLFSIGIPVAIMGIWIIAMRGVSYTANATDSKVLWGGYDLEKEYILDRSVFVIDVGQFIGRHLVLVPEVSFRRCLGKLYTAPDSIDEYLANPEAASVRRFDNFEVKIDVIGVLEKGERLKLHKLEKSTGWSLWFGRATTLTPFAEITSGPLLGKIVDLKDVSVPYREVIGDGPFLYKPGPGVIRDIADENVLDVTTSGCS